MNKVQFPIFYIHNIYLPFHKKLTHKDHRSPVNVSLYFLAEKNVKQYHFFIYAVNTTKLIRYINNPPMLLLSKTVTVT